ncbi:MAG: N-formylglutamate amidohydrolase [Opitutaceae bacterium]|nr:N-formylglutamate amidohydrolase [Opitutaceae bacterium]
MKPDPVRRRLLGLLALGLLAGILSVAAAEKTPGQSYFDAARYVEYVAGDLPIVLTAPHGGRLKPDAIPNRTKGVTDMDANTQELARAVLDALRARTGRHAHLVASHLHRSKLDPNREIEEAAQGDPIAQRAWRDFHAAIEGALAAAVARHGFAFLIDLHGHAHPIARLEIGYALDAKQLNRDDKSFDASGVMQLGTLRDLHARLGGSAAALLRGPGSLGDLFEARGLRATPSLKEPQPGEHPFFSGGYIVRRHAAAPDTPKVDGLQIECPRPGVRDTPENRARFAKITAEVLAVFLKANYGFDLDPKK